MKAATYATYGFRRTLVGLKHQTLVYQTMTMNQFQTDPCGVEATDVNDKPTTARSFRRTLVGLKLLWLCRFKFPSA